jgi:hypothetical protein
MNVAINPIKLSYSKISGLRSMQHISGVEREIIETYRNELTHDIWGNANKLRDWTLKKIENIAQKEYPSKLLDYDDIQNGRNNAVKKWYELLKINSFTKNNPFMQLKILKFVTSNLLENNKQVAPIINNSVLSDTLFQIQKNGGSFRKTYFKLLQDFYSSLNINIEQTPLGKWYTVDVPNEIEAKRNALQFNKIKEFISALSQGTNWCTRSPATVGNDYNNCKFNIFIDVAGVPQVCMTSMGNNKNWFEFIRGKDQYAPIPDKFKEVIRAFLKEHKITDGKVGNLDRVEAISDVLK